ncbi:LuxR C-terminal-related transcriptional regulator [Vibrio europaeus]|uniref:Helix-turn-helix transcriptional regulator n=1 Tax=Vibrio europaeus TaxID=300876 RepID=A0A178JCY9_9VIBR|nr:LuxR C-terminal-related transcriptional regulator [Vibrio europaeus]MDC5703944.1 LuxR C-terminal-related transcriptional regulator [Vibrio europaeus]MDC5708880.1 LuxR C-terminal-related transcriptional regulator [Vibrio europaeus]MDC5713358.1 LuxR C-terminal-related transcriptional regulator [Vibrio europaeus]MDC5719079.1 LuxR C-terminal-related transcriptional regulator [Vibrio europaeus]MDC5724953.1 LuxR C-terminal-related transcriptional regulator [Vibrio europaeus]
MAKNIYARTIYFLTENKSVNPIIERLERRMEIAIPTMAPDDLLLALQQYKHRILIIDYQEYTQLKNVISELPLADKSFETIIFNVSHRLTTDELLAFGHLKAVFYQDLDIEQLVKGYEGVINGETWLPRKVTAQLLFHYRNVVDTHTTPATVDLTTREMQILRCLMSGASNTQIADDMFISEFTVKSHLQKVFKKLSVKNRVQAAAWAKQHMRPLS